MVKSANRASRALRELHEEAGIEATDVTKRGVLTFVYDDQPRPMEVHVYHASRFTGEPVETEEMRPQWQGGHFSRYKQP